MRIGDTLKFGAQCRAASGEDAARHAGGVLLAAPCGSMGRDARRRVRAGRPRILKGGTFPVFCDAVRCGAGCIDRRDADSPVGSDRVKRRGAFAADFVVVVGVERRSRRDVARSKGRRQEKGDRPRRACRRRRRPRAVSCSVTWPAARRRAYAANAGATSVAALAAECRSQVRSGSRTNGICRWRLPLAVAVRPAHSTRRCVAPRRIARFAAEPLSRRPRAEGGAPNPQPASRDAGRPTSGRLVALGPNAGNAPDRAGGERGAEQHDHAALEHRERHALAEKERAP
ncbi:Uncharacterised protein [Burkholderia pseudomallei]|nr:Uncharacterised protein [Burkholderia pseudomallei]VBX83644.1 Uncharacterised protein [Burkholderia pseudomallei]VBX85033.1 Uncharacterised protein [Burkholderia pseudomallei]VBX96865.1 Uncharacterised protein [Burkholderia pseudomallei]VBY07139.1 Uncharacterised protein [Burkholderia pseudomallei]